MQIYSNHPGYGALSPIDARTLLAFGEKYRPTGSLWKNYITYLLITDENPYSIACERAAALSAGTLRTFALADMAEIRALFNKNTPFSGDFVPMAADQNGDDTRTDRKTGGLLSALTKKLSDAGSDADFLDILTGFYQSHGVGVFGLCHAFYLDGAGQIVPVSHFPEVDFDHLFGYESQKEKIIANLDAFLAGRPANNMLLYGDAGTGKSTCVKAALNRYGGAGLRMIQIRKDQYMHMERIIGILRSRNYRFVLFMDDLSFEDFEVEYKGLKAAIEGGLETPPDNLLIFATSNRRHLIRESFDEREGGGDIHRSETTQEKVSLSDRFGLQIRFGIPTQQEYFDMVVFLAVQRGIGMDRESLIDGARKFAMLHSGWSGRVAEQYVRSLK